MISLVIFDVFVMTIMPICVFRWLIFGGKLLNGVRIAFKKATFIDCFLLVHHVDVKNK